jgi:outer membrane protein assembly factor BamB
MRGVSRQAIALVLAFAVLIARIPTTSAATTSSADWRQAGYSAQHSGYNNLETTLTRANVAGLHLDYLPSATLGAVVNGVAYGIAGGRLVALSANTGTLKWSVAPCGGQLSVVPSFGNGRLWVPVSGSFGSRIAAVNPSGSTWVCLPGGGAGYAESYSSPLTANNGMVYAAGDSGTLLGINAVTGKVLWATLAHPAPQSLVSPAVSVDGKSLYVSSKSGNVFKFKASTGAQLWMRSLFPAGLGPVTVSGSTLYVGGYWGLFALSAMTGNLLWEQTLGQPLGFGCCITAPTVANGLVFAGDEDGGGITGISAFNATTGTLAWNAGVADGEQPYPVSVANGVVYVADDFGNLVALNSSTGAHLALIAPPPGGYFYGQPIVVNGMVFAGPVMKVG